MYQFKIFPTLFWNLIMSFYNWKNIGVDSVALCSYLPTFKMVTSLQYALSYWLQCTYTTVILHSCYITLNMTFHPSNVDDIPSVAVQNSVLTFNSDISSYQGLVLITFSVNSL